MKRPLIISSLLVCSLLLCVTAVADDNCVMITSKVFTVHFGIETPLPDLNHPIVIPPAHTDIDIPITPSGWDFSISTDSPSPDTRIELAEGLFHRGLGDRFVWPGISGFAFIGAETDQTIWPFFQSNDPPSPGFASPGSDIANLCSWNPQDLNHNAVKSEKWLRVELVEVRGPVGGHVSMWQESGTSPTVFFSTFLGGIDDNDVYYIIAGKHAHNAWAFTMPGHYEVDLRVNTVYKCDPELTADIDGDCRVTLNDVQMVSMYWLEDDCQTPDWCGGSDIDQSEFVDMYEITAVAEQWLRCGYPDCENE